jgi:excisionase family DNA binding protein
MSKGPERGIFEADPPPKTLLTTKQAARRLNMSEAFLERDRCEGASIRFIRVGKRRVRYHPDDISEYLAKMTGESVGEPLTKGGRTW